MSHFQPSSSSVSSSSVDKTTTPTTRANTTTSSALAVTSASAARLSVKRKAQTDALPNQQAAATRAEADTMLPETKRTRQQRSMNKTEEKVEEKVGEATAAVASEETEVKQSSAGVVVAAAAAEEEEEEEEGAVVDAVGEDDVIVDGLLSATALFPTTFDPQLGRIYTPSTALLFSSKAAAPWYQLSNFYHVSSGVCVDDVMYPSSEHAFQAQKVNAVQRNRFSIHGDLGQAVTGFKLVYGEKKDWMKKKEFWMKKGSIGIIARMAIHPSRIFKLGLTPLNPLIKVEKEQLEQVWLKILRAKYMSQDALQQLLLSTGDQYLAEFSARAKSHDLYACKVNKQTTQQLIGYNVMGLLLMRVRKELLTP